MDDIEGEQHNLKDFLRNINYDYNKGDKRNNKRDLTKNLFIYTVKGRGYTVEVCDCFFLRRE